MSEVICSWTGSRVAFSIFIRNSTNHHRSAPDHRCRSLLTLSRRPSSAPHLSRGPYSPVVHGYIHENAPTRLVPSRGRQLGADTGAITSLLLGEDRRIAFTTSAQPSDPPQTRAMSESWPPTCGKINLLGNVILSLQSQCESVSHFKIILGNPTFPLFIESGAEITQPRSPHCYYNSQEGTNSNGMTNDLRIRVPPSRRRTSNSTEETNETRELFRRLRRYLRYVSISRWKCTISCR